MITAETKISVGELTSWELHWLFVDVEYGIAKKNLSLVELVAEVKAIEARRDRILRNWDYIYGYSTRLQEELTKSAKYVELNDALRAVKQAAYTRSMAEHKDMLETALGIKGETK